MISALLAAAPFFEGSGLDLTTSALGITAIVVFVLAYALVPLEATIHLLKSKPVLVAAGIIWILAAIAYGQQDRAEEVHEAIKHSLLEYAELFLFLLVAMTFINSLQERNVFESLRAALVNRGFSLRKVFWVTGVLAFVISPIADNLTTALLMGAVVMAVGGNNKKFVSVACVNVVVAANAGGAFSPFGDITTLMVWQAGKVSFSQFGAIFVPSLVNWLVPAVLMSLAVGNAQPQKGAEQVRLKYGAIVMTVLFLVTIAIAVCFHNFLHLPPAAGMMFGLGLLGLYSFHVKHHEGRYLNHDGVLGAMNPTPLSRLREVKADPAVINQLVDLHVKPAFAIDTDHKVTHWNKAAEQLTGIREQDIVGTDGHRRAFREEERDILADMVVDGVDREGFDTMYPGRIRPHPEMDDCYEACDFFPKLNNSWFTFTAAPIRNNDGAVTGAIELVEEVEEHQRSAAQFDIMRTVSRAEWDTLLFFYGVILCVGGLAQFGYLAVASEAMYDGLGPTYANSLVGVLSAIIDNIPVMFAVLTMDPDMSLNQWLLITLTAGAGGSMLAIGSAAGVALLGTARGVYTFGSHLKWAPAIIAGYVLSVLCHVLINGT
ncbi:MAG: sodium:proton antiporter NhaD [Planctomycetes bacterium]|nr:sodium:proton antiporter NhaD [Planctomycetota bacterium]